MDTTTKRFTTIVNKITYTCSTPAHTHHHHHHKKVTRKYSKLKKPVYARRQEALAQVPEFWFRVVRCLAVVVCILFLFLFLFECVCVWGGGEWGHTLPSH